MKINISKKQWELIGKEAGWTKTSQNMSDRMDAFFSPKITLVRHKMNGKPIAGYWHIDLVKDFHLAKQFIDEAGIKNKVKFGAIPDSELDAFQSAAGKHGYSVETIGE